MGFWGSPQLRETVALDPNGLARVDYRSFGPWIHWSMARGPFLVIYGLVCRLLISVFGISYIIIIIIFYFGPWIADLWSAVCRLATSVFGIWYIIYYILDIIYYILLSVRGSLICGPRSIFVIFGLVCRLVISVFDIFYIIYITYDLLFIIY